MLLDCLFFDINFNRPIKSWQRIRTRTVKSIGLNNSINQSSVLKSLPVSIKALSYESVIFIFVSCCLRFVMKKAYKGYQSICLFCVSFINKSYCASIVLNNATTQKIKSLPIRP
uniref:Uncharacterized protein n=1 Tax=Sipha flava TaxID=143950 RepID=A0A2S2QIX6_9HEMI